jgi:hypothetical protein
VPDEYKAAFVQLFSDAAIRGAIGFYKLYSLIHKRAPTEEEWAEHFALYGQSGESLESSLMAETGYIDA